MNTSKLIVITGATAGGKTSVAANLAGKINGEIISADSRQVYRGMDIGTGKDLNDYIIDGQRIPFHLIDILNAGEKYNVYQFQHDFFEAFNNIIDRSKLPILCGGTGLYIESVLKGYKLISVPVNEKLRNSLENKSLEELTQILSKYKKLHNISDTDSVKRAVRAIEIEEYYSQNNEKIIEMPQFDYVVFGIKFDRDSRRRRITERLDQRLKEGMIDEVKGLMDSGVSSENLIYYGLEYKYITLFLMGELTYSEMRTKLNTAIHQFSKRQMTWFRKMEKHGIKIHWIDGYELMENKINRIISLL
jgi:tRNA dimethylallyltransferase